MLIQMARILNINIEEIIEKLLMQNDQTSKQLLAMSRALELFEDNDKITNINICITVYT